MAMNPKKDLSHCLAKARVRFWPDFDTPTCATPPGPRRAARFFDLYLWESEADLQTQTRTANAGAASVPDNENWRWRGPWKPGRVSDSLWWLVRTLRLPPEWVWWRRWMRPKVGELHFVQGEWNEEQVGHEVFHATMHVIRAIGPRMEHVIRQATNPAYRRGSAEEDAAYLHGELVAEVYRWLWQVDPNGKWQRLDQTTSLEATHDLHPL
jgi:hypothetical protein